MAYCYDKFYAVAKKPLKNTLGVTISKPLEMPSKKHFLEKNRRKELYAWCLLQESREKSC